MTAKPTTSEPDEIALLKRAGLRLTPQRLAIVRDLLHRDHPTAAQVYDAVRQQFPTIGVATIYATINRLSEQGLLRALPFSDAARYDANVSPHANVVCTRCNRISDFDACDDLLAALRDRATAQLGFRLQEERIALFGLCRECQP